jgi:hypothetical protein
MTYYWIYSQMAGKSSKTLDDTARGYWPRYDATYTAAPATVFAPAQPQQMPSVPQAPAAQPQQDARTLVVSDASAPH